MVEAMERTRIIWRAAILMIENKTIMEVVKLSASANHLEQLATMLLD
jgi:hypothetical protein